MAGIFDNEKDGGILGRVNDFFYKDSGSSLRENISNTLMPPTSEILNRLQTQQQQEKIFTPDKISNYFSDLTAPAPAGNLSYRTDAEKQAAIANQQKTNQSKNPNAKVPNPKDPAENTFLGAVGEYFNTAKTNWKDNGGFEALMSKPEFGIGLSLLQQASEGKTIGEAGLKAALDGGLISRKYAQQIAARAKVLAPITEDQRAEAEAALKKMNVGSPDFLDKLINFRTNQPALFREALTKIAEKAETDAQKKSLEKGGQKVRPDYDKAILDLTDSGELNFRTQQLFGAREGTVFAKPSKAELKLRGIDSAKELGGPVTKGKSYLVGEVGPEVFIPKETGKIVSYDDSKIINLLLESNPQLKSVSPARAEKILRNRFPDYFE